MSSYPFSSHLQYRLTYWKSNINTNTVKLIICSSGANCQNGNCWMDNLHLCLTWCCQSLGWFNMSVILKNKLKQKENKAKKNCKKVNNFVPMHRYFPSAPAVLKIKPRLSDIKGSLCHQVTDLVLSFFFFFFKESLTTKKKHMFYFVGEGHMSQSNVDIKRKTVWVISLFLLCDLSAAISGH